jgi:mannan endo-1,4-beta-mannosidase
MQIGAGGFFCVGCPKVFPRVPTPIPSIAPGKKRQRRGYLTEADLRRLFAKRAKRRLGGRGSQDKSQLRQVRGNWYAPRDAAGQLPLTRIYSHSRTYRVHSVHKRQSITSGSGFDGSFGVDSEDLANAPGVDFSSFQYFPDQNTFGLNQEIDLTDANNIAQNGVDWINLHAETANT